MMLVIPMSLIAILQIDEKAFFTLGPFDPFAYGVL